MTWTFIGRTDPEMPSLCVLTLTEGREYFFRVIAENRHGRSEPLESDVPVIPDRLFEVPPPPLTLEANNIDKDSLTLSWTPPEDAIVTDYLIEIQLMDQGTWNQVAKVPYQVNNYSIKCLPEGAVVMALVIAENKYGASEPTMLDTPVELKNKEGIPSAPTSSPEVNNIGPNYVDLSWKAPESDGGQPVLGYQVEMLDSRSRCWLIMNKTPLSDTHFRVENLYGSTSYQFRVKAINSKGLSDPSPTTAPIFCHDKPKIEAPKFKKEIDDIDLEVGASATFTCKVSGMPTPEITWYKNYRQIYDGRRHRIETKGNKQILTIPEVNFEDAGDIQCQARNKCGISSVRAKLQVFAHAKVSVPAAYQHGLRFFEGDTMKIRLPISGKPAPDIIWAKDGKIMKKDKRTRIQNTEAYSILIIEDVTKSDGGIYNVNISNYYGDETVDISVTIIGTPDSPGKPTVSNITGHTVHLTWIESSSENHSPATGYIVEKCDLTTGVWRHVTSTIACHADVDCLEEYRQYQFRIRAENLFGPSLPSEHSDTIITRKPTEKVDYDELYDATYKGKSVDINHMRGDVLGKYIICEELGRGAFGVVHRAVERATGKNWAAKFIKCRPNEKEAVRREIDLMNSLHHRKLLQLHEAFDQPGEIVMILEFLSGGELFDRLVSNNYMFTEEDCIIYMRQICQGVQHMHRQNIIHLDLKPENVMCVTKDSTDIKLIDFGLAQKIEEGKSIKVLFGTAEFCSPEIINYEPVSFSSDMWSLGVVAYMLLSGYSPFAGDDDQETFTYINSIDFDFDDEVWDYVSDDAKDFIATLLLRDKTERMTIDDALDHPWLNPQEPMDFLDGEAQRNLKKIELPTENHKDYLYRTRNKKKEFDLLPIGCLARDSAIFRREGDDGVMARELIMEMPEFAPEVLDHLIDMTGCEGRKVEFRCTIIGKPVPSIIWYKDGDEIIPSRRTRFSTHEGVSSLFLSDLNLPDAGSYSCKAVNKFGHISTGSNLDIQDVRHRRKTDIVNTSSRYITYDDSHVDPYAPPDIILPLVDESRNIGESVEFSIKVRSMAPVEVTWRHYDDGIFPSEKYKLKKEVDEYSLRISDLNLEDAGRWKCVVVNSYGQTETTCKLTVQNYTLEKYRTPRFTQELHNLVVTEGVEARLTCKVSAHPEPKVTWYKNRQPIENKGPYRVLQTSDETFVLVIDEVVREDIGYYMCQAVNQAGSKSTEAKLAVETLEKPLSLLERNPLQRGRVKSERSGSQKGKYVCAPEFVTKLKSKTVPVDSTVKISCSVSGVPEPEIQWYKNGEKIYSSLNCCMSNNCGLVTLEIAVATHENEGQYLCEASNSEGTISCSAQLNIEGDKKAAGETSENEAPIFLETPLCSTVVIGGDAVFQCVSKGSPPPSFKWTKDGQNVDENDHCSLFVDSHGGCRLVIHNVQESDAGLYMCMAHNTMGRTKCSTRLRVVGADEAHEHRGLSVDRAAGHSHQKFEKIPDPDISNRMMMSGRPPYFTLMLPKLIELNEGDKLRLDCSLEGYPSPVVTWQKGYRELVYDARHRIIAYGTLQTLEIPSVLLTDHGEYFVRAASVFGTIESSCLVKVNKKGKKMSEREYNKMKVPALMPHNKSDGSGPLQAPFFVKHLPHTIDVVEGSDLRLDCSVKDKPKVQKSDNDGDYHGVEGGVTGEEKEGENRTLEPAGDMTSGHASTSAAADSEGQSQKTDPSFTDKFDDTNVTEGEDAVLECKTSGDSDIRWLKDGEVIYSTDHISLIRKGCLHQLYIHGCTKADQALYTCLSSTSTQSEACVAMLSVKRKTPTEDWDTSYADDLLKRWETKKFGSSYVPRTRDKSYSPHRRSYDPSPERDRRYRSSSRDSDIYSSYGKYSGTSYDKYSDYSKTSDKYSSYDKPTERYSRYDNYSRKNDKYSSYDTPTDRYSTDRYSRDRYSTDRYSADRYSADRYSTDRYSADKYTANRYSTDRYTADRYSADKYTADRYSTDRYTADRYSADKYTADRYSTDRYTADKYSSNRYSADRYAGDKYSTDKYSTDKYSTDKYTKDRYSTDRYTKDRYSTDRYSNNRYSAERYSTDRYSTDKPSTDRYSRDRYSSERYLSPKPRPRFSSHERDYYSGSSRYEDKKISRSRRSSIEDKEKTSHLLSEIKDMKADIEIRIEQADDLMKDETAENERIKKEKSKSDVDYKKGQRSSGVEKKEDVHEALVYRCVDSSSKEEEKKKETSEKLDHKTIRRPSPVEAKKDETFEQLDQKTVVMPTKVEEKKVEETSEKLDQKTIERPPVVETKKEETFEQLDQKTVVMPTKVEEKKVEETSEKLDQKTIERPPVVETKKEETFEQLDQKTVVMPTKVEEKKVEETSEKLDQKTIERPQVVETKKEETFEQLDQKTVVMPTKVEEKKVEETSEKLDQKTIERPPVVETKKEETFEQLDQKTVVMPTKVEEKKVEETSEKLDQKTIERPPVVETKKEETFEQLDQKTVVMPTKVEEKKVEETSEKLDQKTIERPPVVETKKEETFEQLDQKTVVMPTKVEEKKVEETSEKLDHKTIERPTKDEEKKKDSESLDYKSVEDKEDAYQKLEYKAVDIPIQIEDKVQLDEKKMKAPTSMAMDTESEFVEKKADDKFIDKKSDVGKVADQVPLSTVQLEPSGQIHEETSKELIQGSKTVDEQISSDLSNQFSERMIKNENNEYEIIKCPEKEVIIEEFPTFSMPPQGSVEDVRRESSEQMGTSELADTAIITKDETDGIKAMSEQKLDTKTKDIEMGKVITMENEKIQSTSIIKEGVDEKSEGSEAKEVSLFTDVEGSGSLFNSKKDSAEEEKMKSIDKKDTSVSLESSQIDGHSFITADDAIFKEKDMDTTEEKVQKKEDIQAGDFGTGTENERDLTTQYARELSSEEKKPKSSVEDDDKIGHVSPELENFAHTIVKKIIEDEIKQQFKTESKETMESTCTEDEEVSEEKANENQTVIIVDMDSEDDEKDTGQQKKDYIVELPLSPADRKPSFNEIADNGQYFTHDGDSPHTPMIEELLSPFRTNEDGQQGIVEEPSEEAFGQQTLTSSDREDEADERLTFGKRFNFEPNNIDQDVLEGRPLDKETHQTSQKEEADRDIKEDIESLGKVRKGYVDDMEKESGPNMSTGLDAEGEKKLGDYSERKVTENYETDTSAVVKETQVSASNEGKQFSDRNSEVVGVSDYEDKAEISSEKSSASEIQQQSEISQKQHSSRQSSFTNQTPESRSSTSSEQVGTGNYRVGRNLTSEDLPAEDDGVWTRKPIFSEDSLSYVSEQASLSGDSHRGIETESNRTSSLERQLSDDETFLLRQTSDESDNLKRQPSDEVSVLQTQTSEYDDSFNRQKPDEETSKDAGIFDTETTKDDSIFQRELKERLTQHLKRTGSVQEETEEYKRKEYDYEEKENVVSDSREECHSEYATSEEESEDSNVTTQTAITKEVDRLSVDTGDFSTTATESMDDDASDERSDRRNVKSMSPMSQDGVTRPPRFRSPGIEEMLKDRQFPPIFVKDLPRLLEVSIGDHLKMSCVIRYIAQIEWKKSGEKITRDRRRRMASDDDGTQTLHIRPVQSDDSGIYSCIAKENDGTTSQTECVLIIRKKAA